MVLRLIPRRSPDVNYLRGDPAHELDGIRPGPAQWSIRGGATPEDIWHDSPRQLVVGYDLIVAAPRPASILLAVGSESEQRHVVAVHRRAVRSVIDYLGADAWRVNSSRDAERRSLPASLSVAVGFTHGVSRWGDPHLHDHVLLPSRDLSWGRAVDSRWLFRHLETADALYRSSLREGIGQMPGRRSWRSFGGVDYVEGVDEYLRALWSGHNLERPEKRLWSRDEILAQWRGDLSRYEAGITMTPPARGERTVDSHVLGQRLWREHDVRRTDVIRAWADATVFGSSAEQIRSEVDEELGRAGFLPRSTAAIPSRVLHSLCRSRERSLGREREMAVEIRSRSRYDWNNSCSCAGASSTHPSSRRGPMPKA